MEICVLYPCVRACVSARARAYMRACARARFGCWFWYVLSSLTQCAHA